MKMKRKTVLGMPAVCFKIFTAVCIVGILIGSLYDYRINVALANKTEIGSFFATYGSYFSYCLYPAAGACLYVGLKAKGERFKTLATVLAVLGWFMAVYYSNSYNGKVVRALFAYTAGESSAFLSVLSWLFWAVLYSWVPFVTVKLLDERNPDKLIAVGAAILIAGITSDNVNLWLKQVASRPRYKYLITLDDPLSEYRDWWQMVPNLAGSNDNFKSWPSGNMTIACMMFALPMITDVFKKQSEGKNRVAFIIACVFVALYGYNRIHMTNHFLTDVCFGMLITYLIFAGISMAFMKTVDKD
ncbi:MAG: phosphatase PAP2 family protein [Erysipelotrichaceae bacterium]|nr:phosphatase PAP2 family protein [Erysipelotrichaceae bacterium]